MAKCKDGHPSTLLSNQCMEHLILQASSSRSSAALRAFLSLLNPIGRQCYGYIYEAASLLEEDEDTELPYQMSNITSISISHV